MAEDSGKGSFWTTLPGILTGLAALITAVGGLVTVIVVSRPPGQDPPPAATATPRPILAQPALQPTLMPLATTQPPVGATAMAPTSGSATFAGATVIQPGASQAAVGPGATVYHQFNVPPSSLAEGDVNPSQACVTIGLLDSAGNTVYHPGGECSTYEYFSILTSSTSGGVYYLRVASGSAIAPAGYTVNLRMAGQDDAGSGADVAGTPEGALSLNPNRTYQGLVGSQDPVDYYQFQATASLKLECLYDEYDDVVITLQQVDAGGRVLAEERVPRTGVVDFAQRPAGRYLLRLSHQAQGAQYTLIFAGG